MRSWCPGMTLSGWVCSRRTVDAAQVRKVESADGLREELMGDFPDVLSDYLSKDLRVKGEPMNIKFREGA